ncbi:MAG: flagellar hook capping FlgD N-terminal domain-containing protein, partial [Buchnera aphidicola]|nr:flagellar biosynthesis protein FlgD [Buchnera aphidicola]MDE5285716.1 flagellar hook capping FlgD N-terminal domain-containing protein [Buchnera aphidicola]
MNKTINPNNFLNLSIDNQKNIKSNNDNKNEDLDLQKNFLNLLIAQIKNQDPIDPIKNTELTSQLAQINTVGGIHQLNNTVEKFATHINKNQNLQISSLIGHHVMTKNPHIKYTTNENVIF